MPDDVRRRSPLTQPKQRLELTWIGKENRPRLEPRILLEDASKSHHAARRVSENDLFDNRLIFGDNLLALKALEQEFAGKVKCIYIDLPFNPGDMFEHYDDGVEHSLWLSQMRDRLIILRNLLCAERSHKSRLADAGGECKAERGEGPLEVGEARHHGEGRADGRKRGGHVLPFLEW